MFMAKFIFKLYMHGSDRTVVINVPLVREVMPKGKLAAFLWSRDERRSERRSSRRTRNILAASSRLASGPSSIKPSLGDWRTAAGGEGSRGGTDG